MSLEDFAILKDLKLLGITDYDWVYGEPHGWAFYLGKNKLLISGDDATLLYELHKYNYNTDIGDAYWDLVSKGTKYKILDYLRDQIEVNKL